MITHKIVYYGPGLAGKTTNLIYIYDSIPSENKTKFACEPGNRILNFSAMFPPKATQFSHQIRVEVVVGSTYTKTDLYQVLAGVEAIVFVADSQWVREDANYYWLELLQENLERHGIKYEETPFVLQLNKRDLPDIMPVELMKERLALKGRTVIEAIAKQGVGVLETFGEIMTQTIGKTSGGSN